MLDSEPAAAYQSPDPFSSTQRSYFRLITAIEAFQKEAFCFSFLSQKGCLHSSSIFSRTKSHSALARFSLFTVSPFSTYLFHPLPILSVTSLPGCPSPPAVGAPLNNSPMTSLRHSIYISQLHGAFPALYRTALCPPVKLLTVPPQELSSARCELSFPNSHSISSFCIIRLSDHAYLEASAGLLWQHTSECPSTNISLSSLFADSLLLDILSPLETASFYPTSPKSRSPTFLLPSQHLFLGIPQVLLMQAAQSYLHPLNFQILFSSEVSAATKIPRKSIWDPEKFFGFSLSSVFSLAGPLLFP